MRSRNGNVNMTKIISFHERETLCHEYPVPCEMFLLIRQVQFSTCFLNRQILWSVVGEIFQKSNYCNNE
jgi:hypothetical protein